MTVKNNHAFESHKLSVPEGKRYFKKLRFILNRVLTKKDALPHEYGVVFQQIPKDAKGIQGSFFRRTIRKGIAEKWPKTRMTETLSLMH